MRTFARSMALRAVKGSAALADRVVPPRPGVVVLAYHRVGAGSGLEVDVPAGLFEAQMARVAGEQRAVTLDDGLVAMGGEPPPRDPVVVTFDDGTADFADHALPILARYRVPATLYVATDFVERGRVFPHDGAPVSWAALRDAASTGLVTVGSHTHTHAVVAGLDPESLDTELNRSIALIEDRLGVPAHHFAYPKGEPGSNACEALVRARFRSAALAVVGANRYRHTDVHRLARSPVQASDGMRWFGHKLDGGMALEGSLRRLLNRRRYAGAVT